MDNNNFDFVFAVNFQEFTDQVAHTLYTHTFSKLFSLIMFHALAHLNHVYEDNNVISVIPHLQFSYVC